jgi:class 3 adenylate cyclase
LFGDGRSQHLEECARTSGRGTGFLRLVSPPESARFCNACGNALEQEASERFRKTVTILFSDVVDTTGLGERLDPETLSYVMRDYFECVKPVFG